MKKFLLIFSIFFSRCLIADPLGVVVNQVSNNVTIIDVTTLSAVTNVPCGTNPFFVAVTTNNTFAFVTNNGSNNVTAIDLSNNTPTTIALDATANTPIAIVITPDNQKALVTNNGVAEVSVIDIPTLTAQVTPIPVGGISSFNKNAIALASGIPSVTNLALVVGNNTNVVTPINLQTLLPLANIPVGTSPVSIAVSNNHKLALVANGGQPAVTPIDLTTLLPGAPIVMPGNCNNIFISDSDDLALVTTTGNLVVPITLSTLTPGAPIAVGGFPGRIDILNHRAYVSAPFNNFILPIDLQPVINPLAPIAVAGPQFAAPTPGSNPIILIGNNGPSTVTVLDPVTLLLGVTIPVGSAPRDIGFTTVNATPISSPTNFSGSQHTVDSLFQKDLVNILSWRAPDVGVSAFYQLFRNSSLTDLVAVINGNETFYFDHDRKDGTVYTYYLVAVDAGGIVSSPSIISVP